MPFDTGKKKLSEKDSKDIVKKHVDIIHNQFDLLRESVNKKTQLLGGHVPFRIEK